MKVQIPKGHSRNVLDHHQIRDRGNGADSRLRCQVFSCKRPSPHVPVSLAETHHRPLVPSFRDEGATVLPPNGRSILAEASWFPLHRHWRPAGPLGSA